MFIGPPRMFGRYRVWCSFSWRGPFFNLPSGGTDPIGRYFSIGSIRQAGLGWVRTFGFTRLIGHTHMYFVDTSGRPVLTGRPEPWVLQHYDWTFIFSYFLSIYIEGCTYSQSVPPASTPHCNRIPLLTDSTFAGLHLFGMYFYWVALSVNLSQRTVLPIAIGLHFYGMHFLSLHLCWGWLFEITT